MPAPASIGTFFKTPGERKRYSIYYGDWLDDGETIVSADFVVTPAGTLKVDAHSIDAAGTTLVFFMNAGVDLLDYVVNIQAVTSGGQTKEDELFAYVRSF